MSRGIQYGRGSEIKEFSVFPTLQEDKNSEGLFPFNPTKDYGCCLDLPFSMSTQSVPNLDIREEPKISLFKKTDYIDLESVCATSFPQSKSKAELNFIDEKIFKAITTTLSSTNFVITLPANFKERQDLLMTVCCNKNIHNNAYEVNFGLDNTLIPPFYEPNIDIINKFKIPEILKGKYPTEYLYKNHEYLATYIYNNINELDCYIVSLLNDRLTEEEKLLSNIGLNSLITLIENTKTFEKVHDIINNNMNILDNKCKTSTGENMLMMIFENNANKKCINSYITLLVESSKESNKESNLITILNEQNDHDNNIFSYCNHSSLTLDSYKNILKLGYNINTLYAKSCEKTNLIFDVCSCINKNIMANNSDTITHQLDILKFLLSTDTIRESTLKLEDNVVFSILDLINKNLLSCRDNKFKSEHVNKLHHLLYDTLSSHVIKNKFININDTNKSNETILSMLVAKTYDLKSLGFSKYYKYLIKHLLSTFSDLDVNYRNDDNEILLEIIIKHNDEEIFELFCEHSEIDLNNVTSYGNNIGFLLIDKICNAQEASSGLQMLIYLLGLNKLNPASCNNEDGKTFLSYLCSKNINISLRLLNKLIDIGIDLNKKDNDNKTMLDYATANKQWLICNMISQKTITNQ